MAIRLRIRELREARGWTLDDLSKRVGTSSPHLSQMERGVKNINQRMMERVAAALGVEPFELLAPRQDQDSITQVLSKLSDDDLARVEAFASALAATRKQNSQ